VVKLSKGEGAGVLTTLYLAINSSIFLKDSVSFQKSFDIDLDKPHSLVAISGFSHF
jgi:hypothetical protein